MSRKWMHLLSCLMVSFALVGTSLSAAPIAAARPRATHSAGHAPRHLHHRRHRVASAGARSKLAQAPAPAPAAAPAVASAPCPDTDLIPAPENLDRVRSATLCLVNQQRGANGLAPLRDSVGLDAAAQSHSSDMVSGNYFDHLAPTGVGLLDRVLATGYAVVDSLVDVGENIATADGSLATPSAIVAGWMSSPEHRANILGAGFRDTGIGVVAASPALLGAGGGGGTYTECFAARQ